MPTTSYEAHDALQRLQDTLRATVDPELLAEIQDAYDDIAVEWLCD